MQWIINDKTGKAIGEGINDFLIKIYTRIEKNNIKPNLQKFCIEFLSYQVIENDFLDCRRMPNCLKERGYILKNKAILQKQINQVPSNKIKKL